MRIATLLDRDMDGTLREIEAYCTGDRERCRRLLASALRVKNRTYSGEKMSGDRLEQARMNARCARSKRLSLYLDRSLKDGECVTAHGRVYSVTEDHGEWKTVEGRKRGRLEMSLSYFPGNPDRTMITYEAEAEEDR